MGPDRKYTFCLSEVSSKDGSNGARSHQDERADADVLSLELSSLFWAANNNRNKQMFGEKQSRVQWTDCDPPQQIDSSWWRGRRGSLDVGDR